MTTQQPDQECFRTPVPPRRHRVHWFAGRTHEVLDELGEPATWAMTPHERGETVAELVALRSRIDAQLAMVVADADRADVAADAGAVNTAGWVRGATNLTGAEATRLVTQARALEAHPATLAALATGEIHTAQATVIAAAVDALPDEVADQRPAAEQHLLECAGEHDAQALRVLGRHLLEVIAPDRADELLAQKLAREEAEAVRTSSLRTWDDGHGAVHGRFKVPALHGQMLRTLLEAIANPARPDRIPREGKATPQVYGQAFCELLERYPVDRVPTSGGVNASVVVTMTPGHPARRAGGGRDPGHRAPDLTGRGAPARLCRRHHPRGPGRRLGGPRPGPQTPAAQQTPCLAMALDQDGLCNITGCDRPASWADAHHPQPWSQGGKTSTQNGELICTRHHSLVHQGHHYPRRT